MSARIDPLDPLPYTAEWPSLRSATGRVDVHSLAAFWVRESKIAGDYYEFGVGQGRSAVAAIRAARKHDLGYAFHLFDSFEGLPELVGADLGSAQFRKGQYAHTQEDVESFLGRHLHHDLDGVHFRKVWFKDLANASFHGKAAIVHVDCDLYESTKPVLHFVTNLLANGTLLLFDDFNAFSASSGHGQRRAMAEWLSFVEHEKQTGKRQHHIEVTPYVDYGWHGKGFICNWI